MTENNNLTKDIIPWACDYLSTHGYTLKSKAPEDVKSTPWSYVVRFATTDGYIYLKHTPNLLALEADITQILHNQFHAPVPEVIANNTELNCFLMKDAGMPLRDILKKKFDAALFCKAIDQFTSLQLAVADHVNIFLDIGVPDWRLDKIPDLYKQLISEKNILITDGLSEVEIDELEKLTPIVSTLCKKLLNYPIKQTIVQCDFHDNNLLLDDVSQQITVIDLGEIVISHPFFSLVGCLRQAKFHHALTEKEDAYQQLVASCFKNYMPFGHVSDAFEIAKTVWIVYEALAQYRLRMACDKEIFMSFQRHGRLRDSLREWMSTVAW